MAQKTWGSPRTSAKPTKVRESEWNLDAPVTAILPFADQFVCTAGDGRVTFVDADASQQTQTVQKAHGGAILSAAVTPDGAALLTGGDDGRVILSRADREPEEVANAGGRWIDHVATGPDGVLAWSTSRKVIVQLSPQERREFSLPSSGGAIAFAPRSKWIAVAHYGGATIWNLGQPDADPWNLQWKGSHLGVTWSPDERFLVTTMQEDALHGWRLEDEADIVMAGYPAKPRSLSWSANGEWLATSGANEAVLWPFKGHGPMGKAPQTLARHTAIVSAVACHPHSAYVAAGFRDGALFLGRQRDLGAALVRGGRNSPIAALAWSRDGRRLAYGAEDGAFGVISFTSFNGPKGAQL